MREPSGIFPPLEVRGSYHQWPFEVGRSEVSELPHTHFSWLGDSIETQAVFRFVNLGNQRVFQLLILHLVHVALEDRLLHTLPNAFADLGHASQAAATLRGFR